MAKFLFWNMGKKALAEPLFRLAMRHEIDVLMLAESPDTPSAILELLNREANLYNFPRTVAPLGSKIQIFTRYPREQIKYRGEHTGFRWTIRQILLPGLPDIILVSLHLPSKLNWRDGSQSSLCFHLTEDIRKMEDRLGHQRTLVVGDFNMNPFEDGMIDAFRLNTESTRLKANRKSRNTYGRYYPFFYNPMWNFFGDATRGPAGTYHYSNKEPVQMSWNIFDQVLLRPALLPFFNFAEMETLTSDGVESFLTQRTGVPRANRGSDHLPIVFKLNL